MRSYGLIRLETDRAIDDMIRTVLRETQSRELPRGAPTHAITRHYIANRLEAVRVADGPPDAPLWTQRGSDGAVRPASRFRNRAGSASEWEARVDRLRVELYPRPRIL